MYCTECGTQLPDNAKFCSNCGQAQNNEVRASQKAQQSSSQDITYEYCEIVHQSKYEASLLGCLFGTIQSFIPSTEPFKPNRVQFWAKAIGPKGQYTADDTIWLNGEYVDSRNPDHSSAQKNLVNRLVADGWEAIDSGEYWYNIKFRRKVQDLANYRIIEKSQTSNEENSDQIEDKSFNENVDITKRASANSIIESIEDLELDVIKTRLNLRRNPSHNSDVLYKLTDIDFVIARERDATGYWVFVENPSGSNVKGWVEIFELDVEFDDIKKLPVR